MISIESEGRSPFRILRHALTISEVFTVVFSPPGFVSFALRLKKKRLHRLARRYSQLSHTLNQRHLQRILREFITHYNRGRPHSALGPGFRNRFRQLFLPVAIDMDCLRATVLRRAGARRPTSWISPGEGGCVTGLNISGPQGV